MQELTQLKESPSQTAGPYVHIGCVPNFCDITGVYPEDLGARMVNAETKGERITVKGTIYDGTGTPLKDALVEIWQADAAGLYPGGRIGIDDPGLCRGGICIAAARRGPGRRRVDSAQRFFHHGRRRRGQCGDIAVIVDFGRCVGRASAEQERGRQGDGNSDVYAFHC